MSALTLAVSNPRGARGAAMRWAELESPGLDLARRAEAWLRQSLCEPPTIADLSAALGASERSLHEAFREHFDATPKAYLKVLRLNAARRDLLAAGEGRRVTDVALDYAFLHFGWFSQDYRRLFGETPHETLQRGRARSARAAATAESGRRGARISAREVPLAMGA
ncbi:MAG TPA: helix-turn-helix transcriptional regulator [Vicinamibacteria bacterium]|nr:helix-turn-helix transcriptional regulator [Vicinamibacteria bacterium]